MTHIYPIAIGHLSDDIIDELAIKVMKQARISTRFHAEKCNFNVSGSHMSLIFMDEADFDDFEMTFYEKNHEFMETHALFEV